MFENRQEIEALFKKYYKEFCLISLQYTGNMEEAEDIVQNLFVKLLTQPPVTEIRDPRKYLQAAVRNESLKSLAKNRPFRVTHEERNMHKDPAPSAEEDMISLEQKLKLYRHIETLPEQCRKVFLLCGLDGLKYKEAADLIGISVNTVKTQMKKAYKTLRNTLSGNGTDQ